jgi:hypothetical protein
VSAAAPAGRARSAFGALAWVSAAYDATLGLPLLAAPRAVAALFGVPAPQPIVTAQVNGVFALALAAGYAWAAAAPLQRRGYFWVAGVLAKGLGAAVFLLDHIVHGSPASLLAFAASDGLFALVTAAMLWRFGSGAERR